MNHSLHMPVRAIVNQSSIFFPGGILHSSQERVSHKDSISAGSARSRNQSIYLFPNSYRDTTSTGRRRGRKRQRGLEIESARERDEWIVAGRASNNVPQSNALVILANAQYQAIVDMRANDVLQDLQMQGPQLFPGLAAVIWYVEKVEGDVVIVESFGE